MPLYRLDDLAPQLASGAWAAPSGDLIGDVRLAERASVWFGAVIRADNTPIIVGADSNIQDGSVCHSDEGYPLTIGHQAILHGCTVADDCLIGMGARILNGAVIQPECIVGAGALVTEGKTFPSCSLIVGTPARVVRQLSDDERRLLRASAAHYVEKAARYAVGFRQVAAESGRQ